MPAPCIESRLKQQFYKNCCLPQRLRAVRRKESRLLCDMFMHQLTQFFRLGFRLGDDALRKSNGDVKIGRNGTWSRDCLMMLPPINCADLMTRKARRMRH